MNDILYYQDEPIKSEREDLLGRTLFAKDFGRIIYNYPADNGLVETCNMVCLK